MAIWWEASVIPYASITGTENAASRPAISLGASGDEQDRINRRLVRWIGLGRRVARARMAWCMVGTAVYQVGRKWSSHSMKFCAWKPGAHATEAPAASEERTAPTSPWM